MRCAAGKALRLVGLLLALNMHIGFAQQSPSLAQPLAQSLVKPHNAIPYRQDQPMGGANMSGVAVAVVLLIAGAAVALRYGAKRGIRVPLRGLRNERLKLVEVLHLSNRSRLYLVEADGERLLVGEQQSSINIQPLKARTNAASDNSESSID
ncbi:MAG TPA: flagellar biosynthetic protein FliO [Rhodocyclaceae bacterium]|nr:flagellar biosynthetic protein FliO [Rhodocyclaceae bacterium]